MPNKKIPPFFRKNVLVKTRNAENKKELLFLLAALILGSSGL
jgi:hypothetical protein